jgi:hypothetical protein
MIITSTRHGRTRRDTRQLLAHLSKQMGQEARVSRIGNVPLSNADDAVRYMEQLRDASRATVSCHHVTLNPSIDLTPDQEREMVDRVLAAYGAEDHAFVVWTHSEKDRASPGKSDRHYHLVISHVGPDGRALDDSWNYVRLEAVARTLELEWGESLTPSRFARPVAELLMAEGRLDVAAAIDLPEQAPESAMGSRSRARASRQGVDLPKEKAAIEQLWVASDGPVSFRAAMAAEGFEIRPGDKKRDALVVFRNDVQVGSLSRILRMKASELRSRFGAEIARPAEIERSLVHVQHDSEVSVTQDPRKIEVFHDAAEETESRARGPRGHDGHQAGGQRVDELARPQGGGRRGSRPGDQGSSDRADDGHQAHQGSPGHSSVNRRAAARLRKGAKPGEVRNIKNVACSAADDYTRRRRRGKAAAVRLQNGVSSQDVRDIRTAATAAADAYVVRRRVARAGALEKLRRVGRDQGFRKFLGWLRDPHERLNLLLNAEHDKAQAIVDRGDVPAELAELRKSAKAIQMAYGKADAALTRSRSGLVEIDARRPSWLYLFERIQWRSDRDRARLAMLAAEQHRTRTKAERDDIRSSLDMSEAAWKRDPNRPEAERRLKAERFEALREIALISEVRRIVKEDPKRAVLGTDRLFGVAAKGLEIRDREKKTNEEIRRYEQDLTPGASGPRPPGG